MKKTRSIFCAMLLSAALVGNVFASTGGTGLLSFFDALAISVAQLLRSGGDDNCRPRQCTTCKPNERDENGDCRPPAG